MKRYIIRLALMAVSALLIPGSSNATVHFGLPSAVKSTVKKLKVKVEEKQKTTVQSYSGKTSSLGIASFSLPSGEVKEIRITDEASQEPLQDITVILTINETGSDGLYFIIDEQGKYLPGIRKISGGHTSPQNFQPKAIPTIVEWAAKTWNDYRGKKPALLEEIDVPYKNLITPLINDGSLQYERSSTLGFLAMEMGGSEIADLAFKIFFVPITGGTYISADLALFKKSEWQMEVNAASWITYWIAQGYKWSDEVDIYELAIGKPISAIDLSFKLLGENLGLPVSSKLLRIIVMRNKNAGTYSSHDINGTIQNASNSQVIDGATIVVNGPSSTQITSDSNGNFAFSMYLPSDEESKEDGSLSINVSKKGFYTSRREIPLKSLTSGQAYIFNIGLTPYSNFGGSPNAPSNLQSSALLPGQITLTWDDNSNDENGFEIEKSTNAVNYHSLDAVGPNITSYIDEGLTGNKTYYYRVRAYNIYGNSTYSNETSTTTLNNPPALSWTGESNYLSDGIYPKTGSTATSFTYHVKYSDMDNDIPASGYPKLRIKKSGVEISGSPFVMSFVSGTPAIGAIYTYSKILSSTGTDYSYYFEAKDLLNASATGTPLIEKTGPTVANWLSVSGGGYHTLAVRTDGTLWAWGYNYYGQLGLGDTTNRNTPTQVGSATNWSFVSGGAYHTLAVKTDGTLWVWGYNYSGQLGLGDTTNRNTPTQVGSATNWSSVSGGNWHTLAVKADGTLWAWGGNTNGQLGVGDTTDRNTPTQVGSATNWSFVSGGWAHTLAIKTDGTLWAWGSNSVGELGLGNTTSKNTPSWVGSATNWSSVSGGWYSTLAIKTDGTLWAWGYNSEGQLGLGDIINKLTPTQVGSATNWSSVSDGYQHTLAIKTDGTLWAWGSNESGQLGVGDTTDRNIPTQVGSATNWSFISSGYRHTMVVKTIGTLWAWGNSNVGQLGLGDYAFKTTPIQVGD